MRNKRNETPCWNVVLGDGSSARLFIVNARLSLTLSARCVRLLPPQRDPADDWSEHISSSGKKYYYNCRTEVSQWEKPKEWLER